MDRSYFGAIERGEINVSLSTIIKIATALDTKPSALLRLASLRRYALRPCPTERKGPQRLSCGPFAVPRAGNSREQARTADHTAQCFRGFSRVFPAVLGL
jgi:transcriptional regulator with XRE-family HTH domain